MGLRKEGNSSGDTGAVSTVNQLEVQVCLKHLFMYYNFCVLQVRQGDHVEVARVVLRPNTSVKLVKQ